MFVKALGWSFTQRNLLCMLWTFTSANIAWLIHIVFNFIQSKDGCTRTPTVPRTAHRPALFGTTERMKYRFRRGIRVLLETSGWRVGGGAWHSYGLRGCVSLPRSRGTCSPLKQLTVHAVHQSVRVCVLSVCLHRALLCAPAAWGTNMHLLKDMNLC